jgi:N utilization substance protein B
MNKKEARDILFTLVFEYEFNPEKNAADIYESALEERGFENFRYIKKGLSDIIAKRDFLAEVIEKYSEGWKISRMAPATRSILFVAAYDMILKSTPCGIAINEAVELAKKYDDLSSVAFINGILNSITKDIDSLKEVKEETPVEESVVETVTTDEE